MIGDFLVGILGNGAYDTAKRVAISLFGDAPDERTSAIHAALDAAAQRFFERYGTTFGRPAESFLARQSNWDVIVKSVYYSAPTLTSVDFDRRGFEGAPDATEEATAFLVTAVEQEMRKN
jgi:hypothetical protein